MAGEAGNIASFISGRPPEYFIPFAWAVLFFTVLYLIFDTRLPKAAFIRWSAAAIVLVAVTCSVQSASARESVLSAFDINVTDTALQSFNYQYNGFIGAFVTNMFSTQVERPPNYSQETMEKLLEGYEAVEADPEAEKFDVVVVLSESFFDARKLPSVTFESNPLPNYDRLLQDPRCRSGTLYTTAAGGGTVRPEFGLLTGLSTDYLPSGSTPYWFVNRPLSGYVSLYKEAGYAVNAIHPYLRKFYSRDSAYPYLGFDRFYDQEDIGELVDDVYFNGGRISDYTSAQAVMNLMDKEKGPAFTFVITMENHQPYSTPKKEDIEIQVTSSALSPDTLGQLQDYTNGLYNADAMLGTLAEWIAAREKPTVLVFFGDHLPSLGANWKAYMETGYFDSSLSTMDPEMRRVQYSTPFIVYSNRDLQWDMFPEHTGNEISDYNLLNAVARATGSARSPFMEYLADWRQRIPYYNVRLNLPRTEDIRTFTSGHRLFTYDRLIGSDWSG